MNLHQLILKYKLFIKRFFEIFENSINSRKKNFFEKEDIRFLISSPLKGKWIHRSSFFKGPGKKTYVTFIVGFLPDPFPFPALVPINLEATKRLRASCPAGCEGEYKGGSRMRLIQKWRRVLVASLRTPRLYTRWICTEREWERVRRDERDDFLNICTTIHNTLLSTLIPFFILVSIQNFFLSIYIVLLAINFRIYF